MNFFPLWSVVFTPQEFENKIAIGLQSWRVTPIGYVKYKHISRATFADISGSIEKNVGMGHAKMRQNVTFTMFKMQFP